MSLIIQLESDFPVLASLSSTLIQGSGDRTYQDVWRDEVSPAAFANPSAAILAASKNAARLAPMLAIPFHAMS